MVAFFLEGTFVLIDATPTTPEHGTSCCRRTRGVAVQCGFWRWQALREAVDSRGLQSHSGVESAPSLFSQDDKLRSPVMRAVAGVSEGTLGRPRPPRVVPEAQSASAEVLPML